MYILTDINNNVSYYSRVLKPLSHEIGKHTNTLRYWLKHPETSLKQGYLITPGIKKLSNKGGKRVK